MRPILITLLLIPITTAHTTASTTGLSVENWSHPGHVEMSSPFEGTFDLADDQNVNGLMLRYVLPDGVTREGTIQRNEDGAYAVTIPPAKTTGEMILWLEAAVSGKEERQTSEQRRVYLTEEVEYDITGNPPEELHMTLGDDGMVNPIFIPCCNILGAVLKAERIPVNPTDVDKGLPKETVGDFVRLKPDPLMISTSGLYLEMKYNPRELDGRDPKNLVVYEFLGDFWDPQFNVTVDTQKQHAKFPCDEGGLFVMAFPDEGE